MYSDHTGVVNAIEFNPNGLYLASTSYDKTLKIWDLRKGSCLYTLTGHSGATSAINFSNDGEYFSSGAMDSLVILWKSNCISEKKTYKNTFNSFPKQFIKNDPLNSPVKIITDIKSQDNLSEELASFFEKMISQMQLVTKTIKKLDGKLEKIENEIEVFNSDRILSNYELEERDKMIDKFNLIKDEYNNELNKFDGIKQFNNTLSFNQ